MKFSRVVTNEDRQETMDKRVIRYVFYLKIKLWTVYILDKRTTDKNYKEINNHHKIIGQEYLNRQKI